jgi:hypothetical protein
MECPTRGADVLQRLRQGLFGKVTADMLPPAEWTPPPGG